MKKLIDTVEKDYLKENFSLSECVVYGIVVPVVLIALMGLAGWMDSMGGL